jgi:hypothetical protein
MASTLLSEVGMAKPRVAINKSIMDDQYIQGVMRQ